MGHQVTTKTFSALLRDCMNRALYFLSCLMPRDPHRYVFIGWHRGTDMEIFADNTKYLFLHMRKARPDLQAIWLAKDEKLARMLRTQGLPSHAENSLMGIWCALRAGTTVIDAYLQGENFRFSGNTRLIQLLHGKGMKKGGYREPPPRPQDIIVSPSPFVSKMLPPEFVQKSEVVIAGYPRNDVLFSDMPGSSISVDLTTVKILQDSRFEKRLWYAPTFRRGSPTLDINAMLDLARLTPWLEKNRYLLVISLHPKYREQVRALSSPNIHFLDDSDVYPLFKYFDLLITDYSSIFTDFLLLDRPLVFYAYDLDAYKEKEGLSFDSYEEYTPGRKAYHASELLETIEFALSRDEHTGERARVRDLYHTHQDGNSSERVLALLTNDEPLQK